MYHHFNKWHPLPQSDFGDDGVERENTLREARTQYRRARDDADCIVDDFDGHHYDHEENFLQNPGIVGEGIRVLRVPVRNECEMDIAMIIVEQQLLFLHSLLYYIS
jgi:hypothetical protein